MTPTQRLAPLLRWAAECAERGHEYEARQMCRAFELTLKHAENRQTPHSVRRALALSYAIEFDPDVDDPAFDWAYAVAYVLLTEEAGQ